MQNDNPVTDAIDILEVGNTLSVQEMADSFRVIMSGNSEDEQIRLFLELLAQRIPTSDELLGASTVMKECVTRLDFPNPGALLDTCGTGGAPKTFNVSTAAGIVAASCGVRVAKHGNTSRTGRGSAEVLERLGVNIHATPEQQLLCLDEAGICFCYAPKHHPAVAHVMHVRKTIGTPTIFNLLGPLTNPCSSGRQLLGVWDDVYVLPMAQSLLAGGTKKSAVVHGLDGLDEISISAPTRVVFVDDLGCTEDILEPESYGLSIWSRELVTANSLEDATRFISDALIKGQHGAIRDMILLSAGVSLYLADVVSGIQEGIERASEAIDSGAVRKTLKLWITLSNTIR